MPIVNIEKATGVIVDINQHYDERRFDNVQIDSAKLAEIDRASRYQVSGGDLIKVSAPRRLQPIHVALDDGVAFSPRHKHGRPQLLALLSGQAAVITDKEELVAAGQTYMIAAGIEHQIVGRAQNTVVQILHL